MARFYISARGRLGVALLISNLASVGLFTMGALSNHSGVFAYLLWNLFLAWLPLLMALWLEVFLRRKLWSSWITLFITLAWLLFLPNSFYLITDFVHVQEVARVDLLYDIVMFSSFVFDGLILGFLSLHLVHTELLRRVSRRAAHTLIELVLVLCSFAIYIGRDLRWNSWDILTHPASVLFDVSDRVLNPREHPQVITTTLSFFVLLSSMYIVWCAVTRATRATKG